jgi:hypothetical protein
MPSASFAAEHSTRQMRPRLFVQLIVYLAVEAPALVNAPLAV